MVICLPLLMMKQGIPGTILTPYLFLMTKYGIEKMIGENTPTICQRIKIS